MHTYSIRTYNYVSDYQLVALRTYGYLEPILWNGFRNPGFAFACLDPFSQGWCCHNRGVGCGLHQSMPKPYAGRPSSREMFGNVREDLRRRIFGAFCWMLGLFAFLPTNGFSIKPLKVKLLAGEQKATEE